ncbi:Phenylacetone monooxygenase [compost metagenome]
MKVYEAGDDVGGVWYWNRYPGAKCDIESIYYNYTFSEELLQEWTWESRYPDQPSILRYLNHVADRFDLRRGIQFNTRVLGAQYDADSRRWQVRCDDGSVVSARYFISAAGVLSSSNTPDFAGLDQFEGEAFHTGQWPHQPVDFTGKRVGVIGTGSSGIQAIPVIAEQAGHLFVFQRTPQYSTPAGNQPYAAEFIREVKANYGEIKQIMRQSWAGAPAPTIGDSALVATPEERQSTYEARWQEGGWLMTLYRDLIVDADANATVGEFIRGKIRSVVRDPAVAEKLMPNYQYATKRPVLDTGYFETFNRDNVTLVDVKSAPIVEFTAKGLRTSEGEYELDAVVFATGYDAITGSLFRMDIRGRDGVALKDKWADGVRSYLGLSTAGFPNFFTITGPESPSVLTNMVLSIEQHVEWIADCIEHMRAQGALSIEATPEAEMGWSQHCKEVADTTLFPRADSWYTGANIAGKSRGFPIYVAGANVYRDICDRVAANGYEGFVLESGEQR